MPVMARADLEEKPGARNLIQVSQVHVRVRDPATPPSLLLSRVCVCRKFKLGPGFRQAFWYETLPSPPGETPTLTFYWHNPQLHNDKSISLGGRSAWSLLGQDLGPGARASWCTLSFTGADVPNCDFSRTRAGLCCPNQWHGGYEVFTCFSRQGRKIQPNLAPKSGSAC